MGVQLDEIEIDEFLRDGHTVILATTRQSGEPFMTPLWFVYHEGAIFIQTPAKSAKVQHIKRDKRVCCLVEEGDKWIDLKSVVLNCDAEFIEDEDTAGVIAKLFNDKYKDFRPNMKATPKSTQKHYSRSTALIKCVPREGEIRSWYNRKIRMKDSA